MRWLSLLTFVLAAVLRPLPNAKAAESALFVALRYEVPPSVGKCWNAAEFRASVARMVGYDPFREDASPLVLVRVEGSTRAVRGLVEWRNASGASLGERPFVAKDGDCTKLLTEMSFAVGLQIELLQPKRPPRPQKADAPPARQDVSPPASKPRASVGAPAESALKIPDAQGSGERWQLWLGLGPFWAWGLSPSISSHGHLGFGLRRWDLSLELSAEGSLAVTRTREDGSGFREWLLGGGAALCAHRAVVSGCLVGKLSQLRVSGFGVDAPRSPNALLAHAGLRIAGTARLSELWSVVPRLEGLALLTPRSVALNGVEFWEMPRVAVLAGIDVAAHFQ